MTLFSAAAAAVVTAVCQLSNFEIELIKQNFIILYHILDV